MVVVNVDRTLDERVVKDMSLDWNVEEIENFKGLVWLPNDDGETFHINPVTNTLIWMTTSVGMNEITKKNWPVFYGRVAALEGYGGAWSWSYKDSEMVFITAEDVKAHIGLGTNASKMTAAAFEKKMLGVVEADLKVTA